MQKRVIRMDLALVDEIKAFRNQLKSAESEFSSVIKQGEELLKRGTNPSYSSNLSSNWKMLNSLIKEIEDFIGRNEGINNKSANLTTSFKEVWRKYTEGLSLAESLGLDTKQLKGYASLRKESEDFDKNYGKKVSKLLGDLATIV